MRSGQVSTLVKRRPVSAGSNETRAAEVDDQARALLRFANGATGSIETSWMAHGRKLTLAFELTCAEGTIYLYFERMNELLLYTVGQEKGREGVKTIVTGPDHPHYSAFVPVAGHHIGFNELKTVEAKILVDAFAGGRPAAWPDFTDAWRVAQTVEAIVRSSRERRWVETAEM